MGTNPLRMVGRRLPPSWEAKGHIMFVGNDGFTLELDDDFQVGVGPESGSAEASEDGVVAASIQKAALVQYDFEPQYIKGEYNKVADALSRRPDFLGALITKFGLADNIAQSLVEAYREDPFMAEIIRRFEAKDKVTSDEFVLVDGLLFLEKTGNKRVCVPNRESLRSLFLGECHDATGHFGYKKTTANLLQQFWWLTMMKDAKLFSKYARLVAMPETAKTEYIIKLFKENWVRDSGLPKSIISDRDVRFTSELWKAAAAEQGTQLQMTSGNHPEANGQAEQLNRALLLCSYLVELELQFCFWFEVKTIWSHVYDAAWFLAFDIAHFPCKPNPFIVGIVIWVIFMLVPVSFFINLRRKKLLGLPDRGTRGISYRQAISARDKMIDKTMTVIPGRIAHYMPYFRDRGMKKLIKELYEMPMQGWEAIPDPLEGQLESTMVDMRHPQDPIDMSMDYNMSTIQFFPHSIHHMPELPEDIDEGLESPVPTDDLFGAHPSSAQLIGR
ncbi:hypothetical protein CBR_g19467 [Chara braunii]|uniref:Integrase catalytic domain-containing protein n=1 Tax=Chara braunii TaxID=69332 RepID=A0A388KYA1_CHABU|nr:hypothetical protein CBR_g19467 [Chara braunii]|eukprot:GBG74952.1 hypothetical protein CBR_g19467 [Chara braunii]